MVSVLFPNPQWFAVSSALPTGLVYVEPRPGTMRFDDDRGTAYCEGRWMLRGVAGEAIRVGDRVSFDIDGIIWLAEGGIHGETAEHRQETTGDGSGNGGHESAAATEEDRS